MGIKPDDFKRVSDGKNVDITTIPDDDNGLYYKDEPYTPHTLHQRLIVTYSPKYACYQKTLRDKQVDRAQKRLASGSVKKECKIQMFLQDLLEKLLLPQMVKMPKYITIWMKKKYKTRSFMTDCMPFQQFYWMMRLKIF